MSEEDSQSSTLAESLVMWRPILILFTALCVTALPAANEYDECKRNDLYESLQRDGESFCTRLLDPECYTSVTTPAKYATYDAGKLSSYVRESKHTLSMKKVNKRGSSR